MRNLIIILCMACAPIVSSLPQYSVEAQIVGSQQPFAQPPAQPFTDSPDANIIAFSPERTRARLAGGATRYPAAPQPQPQYFAPQTAQVPQAVPSAPQQYVQPQPQPQPQPRERSRQPLTPPHPEEEPGQRTHSTTPPIQILKLDKSQSLDGSYKQSWESANNIIVEETGYWKDLGNKDEKSLVQQGSYSYMAPDGTLISTTYTADEGGFKVEGSHLPTPPPIPDEIQKGLNQIYEGIRMQQELDARDLKEGKIRPKLYDDLTGLPIDEGSQNYPQNPTRRIAPHQRQQHYQPVPPQVQPQYQPSQYRSSEYQSIQDQSQYPRQQYRSRK